MDDLGERLVAIEATLRTEVRSLHQKIEQHIQSLNGEVYRLREALRHLDEGMNRRMNEMHATIRLEMQGQLEFPKRVAWLIVSVVLAGLLGGAITLLFKVGTESQRVIDLPTHSPRQERNAQ